jgi:hypothetical protein
MNMTVDDVADFEDFSSDFAAVGKYTRRLNLYRILQSVAFFCVVIGCKHFLRR